MKSLVIATANPHKIEEFSQMLSGFDILSLKDIGFSDDIVEDGSTTEANAKIKAEAVLAFCEKEGKNVGVVADDTGLFVEALDGEPGVHSARYAGNHDDEANRQKLLNRLSGKTNRNAYFETCIYYADSTQRRAFFGRTFGKITEKKIGSDNFGYDCLFYSNDLHKTFGEAQKEEKNSVSHRGRALKSLKEWLLSQK